MKATIIECAEASGTTKEGALGLSELNKILVRLCESLERVEEELRKTNDELKERRITNRKYGWK